MMGDELDLTDEQRDQLENMATDFQMEQIDRRAELKKVQIQLRKLVRDEKASEREVFRLIDEAARLKADMHKARYTHHHQVRTILDDEQVDKLKELHRGRFGDFDIEIIEDDDEDDDRREIRRKIIRKGGGY
jgi:Spy/CpxP family protein refolding chaperone